MEESDKARIPRFINFYNKQLSRIKIKSFYAYHLCQQSCLMSQNSMHTQTCLQQCGMWLRNFYKTKVEASQSQAHGKLFTAIELYGNQQNQQEIKSNQQNYLSAVQSHQHYLKGLDEVLNHKIQVFTGKNK